MARNSDGPAVSPRLHDEDPAIDADFGFTRPGFRQSELAGSVDFYERHIFLRYKNPNFWPSNFGGDKIDELPMLFSRSVSDKKIYMKRPTRLTLCEGYDATETSDGDVLIFPDMIKYRRLAHTDVESFVEQVLVKDGEWVKDTPEKLQGSHVFVCCHAAKDLRCGVCGPALVARFKHETEVNGLESRVSVSPCSHLGGHKYAGNVTIFGPSVDRHVTGHWYGYVTPDDVPVLIKKHILEATIVDQLWRGQMGLTEDEQITCHQQRLQANTADVRNGTNKIRQEHDDDSNLAVCSSGGSSAKSCCQQNPNSCCMKQMKSIDKKVSRI